MAAKGLQCPLPHRAHLLAMRSPEAGLPWRNSGGMVQIAVRFVTPTLKTDIRAFYKGC